MAHEGSARERSTGQSTPGRLDGRCGKPAPAAHIRQGGLIGGRLLRHDLGGHRPSSLPDAVAISEPGRDYTFAEFDDRAARLAAALERPESARATRSRCYLYNGAAYLETVFAAFKLGAVPVNANYRYTRDELTALLADADAAALVFSGDLAANVAHAAQSLPSLRLLVRVGPADAEARGRRRRSATLPELSGIYAATAPRPAAAPPRLRSALHVHRRHHRQAEGRDLAHVGPAAARCRSRTVRPPRRRRAARHARRTGGGRARGRGPRAGRPWCSPWCR